MQTVILTLCVGGFILVVAELFLPGLIAGVLGTILMVAACVLTYREYGVEAGTVMVLTLFALSAIGFAVWMKIFPGTPVGRVLTLGAAVGSAPRVHETQHLLGMEGEALTNLRPAGTALLGGRRIDVVAENEFIGPSARVRVVEVDGLRVVVRKVAAEPAGDGR